VPAATIERVEAPTIRAAALLDLSAELAEHALSAAGVAGLHLISFRRDDRRRRALSHDWASDREPKESMHTVLQSRSKTVIIGTTSRSA
jgi:hypothetical protein